MRVGTFGRFLPRAALSNNDENCIANEIAALRAWQATVSVTHMCVDRDLLSVGGSVPCVPTRCLQRDVPSSV